MEQMRYNLLFRWLVRLAIEDAVWDHAVFSKNHDHLLEHEMVDLFFPEVMSLAGKQGLLSREHFSVDGTLIQEGGQHKNFRPKDGLDEPPAGGGRKVGTDWKGKRRSNDTRHRAPIWTRPRCATGRQSGAILCYQGHILMENCSGSMVGAVVSHDVRTFASLSQRLRSRSHYSQRTCRLRGSSPQFLAYSHPHAKVVRRSRSTAVKITRAVVIVMFSALHASISTRPLIIPSSVARRNMETIGHARFFGPAMLPQCVRHRLSAAFNRTAPGVIEAGWLRLRQVFRYIGTLANDSCRMGTP